MTRGEVSFAWPIVAGKEEVWRRAFQELEGSRSGDLDRMRRRLGIGTVRVWLQRTRSGAMAVVHMEVEDPAKTVEALAGSDGAFERWLKRKIEECHGRDWTRAWFYTAPELIFESGSAEASVPRGRQPGVAIQKAVGVPEHHPEEDGRQTKR